MRPEAQTFSITVKKEGKDPEATYTFVKASFDPNPPPPKSPPKPKVKQAKVEKKPQSPRKSPPAKVAAPVPITIPLIQPKEVPQKSTQFVVPSCASWFDFDQIHPIEEESCPEFFNGKYPTKNYVEYRNFMVQMSRDVPNRYLTATTCRRHLSGDACSVVRVHAFLEMWGLINFNVDPYQKPHNLAMNKESAFNKFCVNAANKYFADKSEGQVGSSLSQASEGKVKPSKHLIKKLQFLSRHKRPYCDYCGVLCGLKWFMRSSKEKDDLDEDYKVENKLQEMNSSYKICTDCMEIGNFPQVHAKTDFETCSMSSILTTDSIDLDSDKGSSEPWVKTDQLTLIKAIYEHGDNWEEVMKLFKQRSKEDCLREFLRIPIDENLIDHASHNLFPPQSSPEILQPTEGLSIFGDISNPVLIEAAVFGKLLDEHQIFDPEIKDEEEEFVPTRRQTRSEITPVVGEKRERDEGDSLLTKEETLKVLKRTQERAQLLRKREKKEMRKIIGQIIELQMKKINLKTDFLSMQEAINLKAKEVSLMQSKLLKEKLEEK